MSLRITGHIIYDWQMKHNKLHNSSQPFYSESPTATVVPALHAVLEGSGASFRCLANGTEASVVWSLVDSQPLPRGVDQRASELVIEEVYRQHAQQYKCTVTNAVGDSDRSVATLMVSCKLRR